MMRKLWLPLGILLMAMPAFGQSTKSNPDLFLQCADYDNSYRSIRAQMDDEKFEARYMNDEKDQYDAQLDDHERELNRLDEILKIMRNSDSVWDKRESEYYRYSRLFDEYEDFMVRYNRSRQSYQKLIDRSQSLRQKLDGQCFGTWSKSTIDQFCGKGNTRMQAFCSRFGS